MQSCTLCSDRAHRRAFSLNNGIPDIDAFEVLLGLTSISHTFSVNDLLRHEGNKTISEGVSSIGD
ncbi:MAG: hypothetical protein CMK07_06335 [Ponticaulis sp.]|nr:hypothetical protein [Ponticaulis sp.]